MLKNIAYVFSSKLGSVLLTFLVSIVLARGLGVEGRGYLAALLIMPQLLLSLMEGGMRQASTYFIGKNKLSQSEVFGAIILYGVISGVLGYLICLFLMKNYGASNYDLNLVLLASVNLPLELFASFMRGIFLGKESFYRYNKVIIFPKIIYLIVLSLMYFYGYISVVNALLALIFSSALNILQTYYFLIKIEHIKPVFNFQAVLSMLKVGVVYALALFFINANYKIDILLLSHLSSDLETGLYIISSQVGEVLWQLPGAIVVVLMAKSANSKSSSMIAKVSKITRLSLFFTLVLSIVLVLISKIVIPWVFGKDFAQSATILYYLIPGLVVMVVFKTINADYAGSGRPIISLLILIPTTLMNIVFNLFLIPKYGAVGAAISSTMCYVLASASILFKYSKDNKVSIKPFIFVSREDFLFLKRFSF